MSFASSGRFLGNSAGLALAAALSVVAQPASAQLTQGAQTPVACPDGSAPQPNTPCPVGTEVATPDTRPDAAGDQSERAGPTGRNDIVVTGSRIKVRNLTSLEPTVTVGDAYLENRGITNVANALNELPQFRGSETPDGAQGSYGQGINFVNQFGLGSNRTLVLVDGKRFVTSNVTSLFNSSSYGSQVDLNVIPSILVDRIEDISIGGAPVYGSDAIAGVVNIILKNRYKGVTTSFTSGVTEEGDNFRYNASILAGHDFAGGKGNVTLSYSHDSVDGVLYNGRDFLRQNLGNVTNPSSAQAASLGRGTTITPANDGRIDPNIGYNNSSTDGFPGSIVARDVSIYYLTRGGLITYNQNAAGNGVAGVNQRYQFDRSGNLVPFNRGIIFPGIYASGGDGFRFNDFSQITSDLKRDTVNGFVSYDFSDAARFFASGEWYHARADQLVTQPTFNSNLFGGTSGPLSFDITNPFLTDQARQQLQALGVSSFDVSRASVDLADTSGFSQTDILRGVAGMRGDFTLGGHALNYEVSGTYGRTLIRDTNQDLNAQNFINAVNVTRNAAGQIVCTTAPTTAGSENGFAAPEGTPIADSACVPLNIFGEGVASAAARNYVVNQHTTRSVLEQYVINANVGGELFKLFGNQTSFNIGYEHRNEKGSFTPSQFEQQGLGRSVPISPLSGQYNTDEVFGEVQVPLVTPDNGLSFLNQFTVFGRGRYVDNTVNGGFFSWAVGGTIAPVRDIAFRGNFTRSFRAPAITELFLPVSNAFDTVDDLCAPGAINGGPAPATRQRNCAAFLAKYPNATPLDAASATVPSQSGGNPTLKNEVANSYTFGVILQPRWIRGLSITADYLHISIDNPISNLSVATIDSACFDNPDFNAADPANGNAFCSQIKRYASGQGGTAANGGDRGGQVIVDPLNPGVVSGFTNGKNYFYEGIQATIAYRTSLNGLHLPGTLSFDGNLLYTGKRVNDITGVAPQRIDGTLGDPTFAGQFNVAYLGDGYGLVSSFNYTGQQLFSRVSRGADIREFDKLKDFVTINPSIYIDVAKQFRFNFSVTNLLNRRGQKFGDYIIPASYSDLLGRRFTASVQLTF
ncbi:TonB-dependent receptor [Sphingomonas sp. MA1305]|uniref:TonB-dependent receptor domain-containing protein n=1 Tax=Sphingomonas sp. MA1305 TaxID=2479204 RepID=UPI0018E0461C|nr:TonB-dependent receptor [Sphingomonas sp. MA1305]MBI0476534.1 TonB-dependent receptor [Sphingomonas sp. MA1305]